MGAPALARIVLVAAVAGGQVGAQGPVQFRAGVDLIHLDVSVFDRNRQPVRGLTAADFTVLEDGKPQDIAAFKAVDVPDPEPPPSAAWIRDVSPDVKTNAVRDDRLLVLVLDDALLPFDVQLIASAKDIARRVVDRLGPSDLAAIVFTRDNRRAQELTGDRAALLKAIDAFSPGTAGMPGAIGSEIAAVAMLRTLSQIADSLSDVTGRRKAIILISVGVPIDYDGLRGGGGGVATQMQFEAMRTAFEKARLANVTIYPVDPGGLGGVEAYIRNELLKRGGNAFLVAHQRATLLLDSLRTVAENTGGDAITDSNDFAPGLTKIFQQNDSFYLLGYVSTNRRADGRFRKIEVRVRRPGVEVRTRNGYVAPSDKPSKRPPPSPAVRALSGALPVTDIPMRVSVAPFAVPGRSELTLAIVADVRQAPSSGSTTGVDELDFVARAFTPDGELRASRTQGARLTRRPGARADEHVEVFSELDLKPGHYSLRFSVHSSLSNLSGSVYHEVDVEDVFKQPVSMSGVVLGDEQTAGSSTGGTLSALLPIVPTTEREFSTTDRVVAFLQLYHGGSRPTTPIPLTVRIVDASDRVVFSVEQAFGPDRFDTNRSAPYRFDLPLSRLTPGRYLLTFEATLGKTTARRFVQFVVGASGR